MMLETVILSSLLWTVVSSSQQAPEPPAPYASSATEMAANLNDLPDSPSGRLTQYYIENANGGHVWKNVENLWHKLLSSRIAGIFYSLSVNQTSRLVKELTTILSLAEPLGETQRLKIISMIAHKTQATDMENEHLSTLKPALLKSMEQGFVNFNETPATNTKARIIAYTRISALFTESECKNQILPKFVAEVRGFLLAYDKKRQQLDTHLSTIQTPFKTTFRNYVEIFNSFTRIDNLDLLAQIRRFLQHSCKSSKAEFQSTMSRASISHGEQLASVIFDVPAIEKVSLLEANGLDQSIEEPTLLESIEIAAKNTSSFSETQRSTIATLRESVKKLQQEFNDWRATREASHAALADEPSATNADGQRVYLLVATSPHDIFQRDTLTEAIEATNSLLTDATWDVSKETKLRNDLTTQQWQLKIQRDLLTNLVDESGAFTAEYFSAIDFLYANQYSHRTLPSPKEIVPISYPLTKSLPFKVIDAIARHPSPPTLDTKQGDDELVRWLTQKLLTEVQSNIYHKLVYALKLLPISTLSKVFRTLFNSSASSLTEIHDRLFALTAVDLSSGGGVYSLAEPTAYNILKTLSLPANTLSTWTQTAHALEASATSLAEPGILASSENPLVQQIKDRLQRERPCDSVLGRTCLLATSPMIAIKVLKRGESISEFHQELVLQAFLNAQKSTWQIQSDLPQPIGLYLLSKPVHNKITTKIKENIPVRQALAHPQQKPSVKSIVLEQASVSTTVMIYQAQPSYFAYFNEEERPRSLALSDGQFEIARKKIIADLILLLKKGVVFPQLIDLQHNAERPYDALVNIRRIYGNGYQGLGKISEWKRAARYPNIRLSGLADLGDMVALGKLRFDYADYPNTIEDPSIRHGQLWTLGPDNVRLYLLPYYLSNYLFSVYLNECHRFFVARSDRQTPVPNRNRLPVALQIADKRFSADTVTFSERLATTLRDFANLTCLAFSTEPNRCKGSFFTADDVRTLVKQSFYFMSGFYAQNYRNWLFDNYEDYAPRASDTRLDTSSEQSSVNQVLYNNAHVFPFLPMTEMQGAGDASNKSILGNFGLYSYSYKGSVNKAVRDTIQGECERSKKCPQYNVDLGFVNGPLPIARIQQLLSKIVSLALFCSLAEGDAPALCTTPLP